MPTTVTFYGAAQSVTGSMHHVETDGFRLLLDCGLFQGRRAEARQRNCCFPFAPRDINAVVLSHAHIDHSGNLPNLVRQGYTGPIYCTPATSDLAAVLLADSAKIQEEDADYLNRHQDRDQPAIEPLYRREDAHRTAGLFHGIPYNRPFDLGHGVRFQFVDAGHILGSAMPSLTFADGKRLTFTGDLGHPGQPILRDPAPVPAADLLISESTYGGKVHPAPELLADALAEVVRRTAARGGTLLIPAFSVGRTQTVVYFLNRLIAAGKVPDMPVYIDSPLSVDATAVFRLHPECFNEETTRELEDNPDLFGGPRIHYVRSVEESKKLNGRRDPCVIIASSGMCEAGRILHHLKHRVEDERNTVLIVGFQAPDTLGYRLVKHVPEVRILDRPVKVRAEVVVLNGFSSHADREDFRRLFAPLAGKTARVRLVHGEDQQAEELAQMLREMGFADVAAPARGDQVNL